jgi:hypothetical protein
VTVHPPAPTEGPLLQTLLETLRRRFDAHPHRHPDISWAVFESSLLDAPAAWRALEAMESTGGEPDLIGRDPETGRLIVCDCAPESPIGRRSLCYDEPARLARKENRPTGSAVGMAESLGIQLLTEAQYRALQALGPVDQKTSSWIETPPAIRALGGALFSDYRYGTVFTYHNGAGSYYAARGFRGQILL